MGFNQTFHNRVYSDLNRMTTDETQGERDNLMRAVDKALQDVMEHADSVVIIVTKFEVEEKQTMRYWRTGGNAYASIAVAQEWLENQAPAVPDTEEADE